MSAGLSVDARTTRKTRKCNRPRSDRQRRLRAVESSKTIARDRHSWSQAIGVLTAPVYQAGYHGGTHADAQRADDRESSYFRTTPRRPIPAAAAFPISRERSVPPFSSLQDHQLTAVARPPFLPLLFNSNPRSCSCARARTRARARASSSPTSTHAWRSWTPSAQPWCVPDRAPTALKKNPEPPLGTPFCPPDLPQLTLTHLHPSTHRARADWTSSCTTTAAPPPSPTTAPRS